MFLHCLEGCSGSVTTWCAENKLKLLQRARSNEKLHCCCQASTWFGLCAISKITLLSFLGSYIWFTTHNSVNCGCDTCRGSPRGPTSGSVSGSRGVCSSKQLQRIVGQSSADLTFLLPEVDQPSQTEFRFYFFFLFCWDLRLLGSNIVANRRPRQAGSGHHSTGPWARGKHPPCGFPLLTNIKDLAFVFGCFCSLFVHHFVVINKIRFLKRNPIFHQLCSNKCINLFTRTLWKFVFITKSFSSAATIITLFKDLCV